MPQINLQPFNKPANAAATYTIRTAVVLAEPSAALAPFQRHQPGFPPT